MTTEQHYGFAIGQAYPATQASSPQDYLDAALQAERYIAAHQISNEDGIHWRTDDGTEKVELYEGASGITYFYLQLYRVTGDERYADIVRKASRYLSRHWRDAIGSTIFENVGPNHGTLDLRHGLYRGIGGPALILLEAYKEFHDPSFADGATEIIRYYQSIASHNEHGAYWYGSSSIYLDGGIILLLIAYDQLFHDDQTRQLIDDAARFYLTLGDDDGNGGLFFDGIGDLMGSTWQNLEFGSPGAALVLSRLYEHNGNTVYLDTARKALVHAESVTLPVGDGKLIPFNILADGTPVRSDDGKPIFYLGWCNGFVGTSLAYYAVCHATQDAQYWHSIEQFADAAESLGAPDHESAGLWNSVCYCCGHTSILQHYDNLYVTTGDPRWLQLAERTASVLLGTKEDLPDGGADWPIAWERIHPDHITRSLGYFDGAAGAATSLLQLYELLTKGRDGFSWHRLIDDPYPESAH